MAALLEQFAGVKLLQKFAHRQHIKMIVMTRSLSSVNSDHPIDVNGGI